ncbi:MAG: hypothetical protein ABI723_04440 [Bacteroidia bacterium]
MKNDREILEAVIVGGLIGATLGTLIFNDKNGSGLGALAGAAILSSYRANENARRTKIPLIIEEENALYEIKPDGSRRFIKSIPKNTKPIPQKFTLK